MKLFISYAHIDEYIVQQVVHILTYANYNPWFDKALITGADWKDQLTEAIQNSDAFVYALSPESVSSEWCQWEFTQAVSLDKPIIPVLLRDKTKLPESLSRYQYADFTKGPTGEAVARLMGGLQDISVKIPNDLVSMSIEPTGTPAQAKSSEESIVEIPIAQIKESSNWITGILKRFVKPRHQNYWNELICPRCLVELEIDQRHLEISCPNCFFQIPGTYVANFTSAPPFFIQVFGWTNHGKTIYLDALRLILSEMHDVWDSYVYQPINEIAKWREQEIHEERRYGVPASSTHRRFLQQNDANLVLIDNLPRWGSRTLVVMDHAGEFFHGFDIPVDEMPYLTGVPITFMMISLPMLLSDAEFGNLTSSRIDWLLNIYISALLSKGIDFTKNPRKLVVIFTLGDMVQILPDPIKDYLLSDKLSTPSISARNPNTSLKYMSDYLHEMNNISNQIERLLLTQRNFVPGGANFVNLAKKYGIEVKYSIVSALGRDISDEDRGLEIAPKRVLDPLFWGLEFEKQLNS